VCNYFYCTLNGGGGNTSFSKTIGGWQFKNLPDRELYFWRNNSAYFMAMFVISSMICYLKDKFFPLFPQGN